MEASYRQLNDWLGEKRVCEKYFGNSGEELLVKLRLVVGKEKPSGLIIVEKIPENFSYVKSNPEATFNQVSRELKWVFYGKSLESGEISYTISSAKGFTGKAAFSGEAKTLLGTEEITGTKEIVVVEAEVEKKGINSTPAILIITTIALLVIALKYHKNRE